VPTTSWFERVRFRRTLYRTLPDGSSSYVNFDDYMYPYGPECYRTTVSNPSWKIQIAKKQDAGRVYSLAYMEAKARPSSCKSSCYAGGNKGTKEDAYVFSIQPGFPTIITNGDSNLSSLALERLKRKLRKRPGGADALAPTAEVKELKGLVQQATKMTEDLLLAVVNVKRTKGKSLYEYAGKAHKTAASAWLAYGFGVRPLIGDIENVIDAIGNYYLNKGNTGIRDSASAKRDWMVHSTRDQLLASPRGPQLYAQTTYHYRLSYRYYCGGHLSVIAGNDYGIMKHLGFSSEKLVPAFWELMPYSWVFDYFTNIGEYLEDTFQVLPGTMNYAGVTRRLKITANTTFSWVIPANWYAAPVSGSSVVVRDEFERTPIGTTLPYTGIRFKSVDEIGKFGISKVLNLASVIMQRK